MRNLVYDIIAFLIIASILFIKFNEKRCYFDRFGDCTDTVISEKENVIIDTCIPQELIKGKDISKWVLQLKDVYCKHPDSIRTKQGQLMFKTLWLSIHQRDEWETGGVDDMNSVLTINDDEAFIIRHIYNSLSEAKARKIRETLDLNSY